MNFNSIRLPAILALILFCFLTSEATPSTPEGYKILRSDSRGIVIELTTEVPELIETEIDGETFTTLSVSGYGQTTEPGKPQLPIRSYMVGIPPAGEVKAKVLESEYTTIKAGCIRPVVEVSIGDGPSGDVLSKIEPTFDAEFYSQNAFYPPDIVEISPLGFIRANRVARLEVHPFRYNPATGELRTYTHLAVQVDLGVAGTQLKSALPSPTSGPFEDILSRTLLNYQNAKSWRRPSLRAGWAPLRPAGLAERYKILVEEDGIYHIDYGKLSEAGIDLSGTDPRMIKITNKGREIPIYVKGEGDGSFDADDYIEFYGEANRYDGPEDDLYKDPYTDVNVYWLSWDGSRGLRMAEESGGIVETDPTKYREPYSYEFTVHAEEDNAYDRLRQSTTSADHWFWGSVEAQQSGSHNVALSKPDVNSTVLTRVRTMLHGKTYPDESPDHHALISLNDRLVADETWDGQTKLLSEGEIPSSSLQDGTNALNIICPGDTPAKSVDIIYLNWFEVEYPRLYQAEDDYIEFTKPKGEGGGLYQFVIGGFSRPDIEIFKKEVSRIVGFEVEYVKEEGFYQATFQDSVLSSETEYIALTPARKLSPTAIEQDEPSGLKSTANGAEYIFITHENFYDNLQTLSNFWEERNLSVKVVKTTDIYDEFNYGIFSPEAIRDFLRYAYENWNPSPTYVLLVGDGSWDYKDRYGRGGNFVPVYPTYTYRWGSTAGDHLYACISGDDLLPDLLIGRLPVRTNAELNGMVNKIIDYVNNPEFGEWRKDILMIGGSGVDFRTQSNSLISDYISPEPEYDVSRLYVTPGPYFGGTQDLIDELDEGAVLVNFLGHGGGAIWSDAGLFRFGDVPRLHNQRRLPLILSLTCFTVAFDEPYRSSLGEEFLKAEEKGAVGIFGSTGLGWLYNDYYINQEIFDLIFEGQPGSIGQTLAEAKITYLSKYGIGSIPESMVKHYTLLGDPALSLEFPEHEVSVTLDSYRLSPGETVNVSGRIDTIPEGMAKIKVVQGGVTDSTSTTVTNGSFAANLSVSDTAGVVKAYVWSDLQKKDGMGFAAFTVDTVFFGNILTNPRHPTCTDSVHIQVNIDGIDEIGSVTCHVDTLSLTIPMSSLPGDNLTYRTTQAIPAQSAYEEIEFYFSAVNGQGDSTISDTFSYEIGTIDLAIEDPYLTGTKSVQLAARVKNEGKVTADSVAVRFFHGHPDSTGSQLLNAATIDSLSRRKSQVATIEHSFDPGQYDIYVWVDPDDLIGETNENNNQDHRNIWVDRFKAIPGDSTNITLWGGKLRFNIPPGAVADSTVLKVSVAESLNILEQPDISFAQVDTAGQPLDSTAFRVVWADSAADPSLKEEMRISLAYDTAAVADTLDLRAYRWHGGNRKWVVLDSIQVDSLAATVTGKSSRLGTFTIMANGDYTSPTIEVAVEGQHFVSGDYVPPEPKFAVVIQDDNGVNTDPGRIQLELVPPADDPQAIYPDSVANANTVPVSYSPRLQTGDYTLSISAADCNGNTAQDTVYFAVVADFDIRGVGNYPNPFTDGVVETVEGVRARTIFTYRLTGRADELSLKVYTVSGRLIRSFEEFTSSSNYRSAGYHEIPWNGTDDNGEEIANGVYFYRIKGRNGGQTVQKTMKLAKIR